MSEDKSSGDIKLMEALKIVNRNSHTEKYIYLMKTKDKIRLEKRRGKW